MVPPRRRVKGVYTDTKPERTLKSLLVGLGIAYKQSKRVCGVLVDFYIPHVKLIIEVDGCYYHACPIHDKTGRYKKKAEKDRRNEVLWREKGYRFFRVWEHSLKTYSDCDLVKRHIAEAVEHYESQRDSRKNKKVRGRRKSD